MLAQVPPKAPLPKPLIRIEPNPIRSGVTSIYTDAAWNSSSESARLGWIIDALVSPSHHSATSDHMSSPLMAKALAVRSAINFALSCGIDAISLLSDSQTLISTINHIEMKLEIFNILRDIYLNTSSFKTIWFIFISRSVNDKADSVAKKAMWPLNPF
ncbi:hypothetical protein IGI04_040294 [Brassica rapa subsp. trilocularis]|uniref:RNase H type-1 domain-containing protein n=1 Tax=Brassica rapa subsp. trilocularis TaxID=1813537 RepID=A0ABQ7KMF1_BRACM|nr:hypothetical protein IGI04_040294 [Brassica rapa subsp. trilocularis]